jgi:hypothetical protein
MNGDSFLFFFFNKKKKNYFRYLKADGYPNRTSFDSADLGVGSPMRVGVSAPGAQRFYIGVFGW